MDIEALLVAAMFATLFSLLLTGFPVAFILAGTGLIFAVLGEILNAGGIRVDAHLGFLGFVTNRFFTSATSLALIPIPLFIFMGFMLDRSGVAHRLMGAMQRVLGRLPGGLAVSVTVIGVILAASTGIIGASVVLLATVALPNMLKQGYSVPLATGTIGAAGCLGVLIPPSIMLVVMADQMTLSVGSLFMGALLPGLVLAGLYIVYIIVFALLRPSQAPRFQALEGAPGGLSAVLDLIRTLVAPLALIFAVLGSIFFGIASPTEAAAVGAFGATLLALLNGGFGFAVLREVSEATARTTCFIFGIFFGATLFAVVLRGLGGDDVVRGLLLGLDLAPSGVLAVALAVVFVLGFFLDWVEITVIVLPIFGPALIQLGLDPIWFTVLMAICLQTSFLTPPMGPALFFLKGVAPAEVGIGAIYRGIIPFTMLQLAGLAIAFAFPKLITLLPDLVFG